VVVDLEVRYFDKEGLPVC